MKKTYKYLLLIFILFSFAPELLAQQVTDTLKTHRLEEIIIRERRQVKKDSVSKVLKLEGKLLETPQNFISIDNNLLRMQGGFELQDALRNVSGVFIEGGASTNNIFSTGNISIRGFTGVSIRRNGLAANTGAASQEDESLIEEIEVIKGPAGFVSSTGEPGGSINVNTKVPRSYAIAAATVTAGSFDFYRASADLGSKVKDKGFSFRFNTAYETRAYNVDFLKRAKVVVAPLVQYNFNKNTYLLAEYNLISQGAKNGTQSSMFDSDQTLQTSPRSANYMADPGLPHSDVDETQARLLFTHKFNDNLKITSQSVYSNLYSNRWSMNNGSASGGPLRFNASGIASRKSYNYKFDNDSWVSQLFVNGKYKLSDDFTYRGLIGIDYSKAKGDTYQASSVKRFPFDRNNPVYGLNTADLTEVAAPATYYSKTMAVGTYLYNDLIYKNKLFLNFGLRFNYGDVATHNYRAPEDVKYSYRSFKPRVGLTYMLRKDMSIFALYDETFQPQGLNAMGGVTKPLESYNTEGGIKKDWLKGVLSTTVTAYIINRNNMFLYDPALQTNVQVGQVRSKGIEFDALGSPTKNITLSVNYSLLSSVVSKDEITPANVGTRFASVPRQQINAWAMYSINSGSLQGLSVGFGQTSFIDVATFAKLVPNLPNYTKIDATVMYKHSKWYVRLFLDNLTDKRYISAASVSDRYAGNDIVGSNWAYQEGMPMNFKIQLGVNF